MAAEQQPTKCFHTAGLQPAPFAAQVIDPSEIMSTIKIMIMKCVIFVGLRIMIHGTDGGDRPRSGRRAAPPMSRGSLHFKCGAYTYSATPVK